MRKVVLTVIGFFLYGISIAQQPSSSFKNDFSFWIGKWNTEASVPPKWEAKKGKDVVRYLLDNTLIEEVFTKKDKAKTNFQRGYLYYLKREKRWRHTIYDSKWGEYSFYGNREGDKIVLYSDPKSTRPGVRRETFYNISKNSFDYKWETSRDGGKTWREIWKVKYVRQNN